MLWNAAKKYSNRKRVQRKTTEKEKKITDCIEVSSAAWLNTIFSIYYGAKTGLSLGYKHSRR
jgi:hypothetical protein